MKLVVAVVPIRGDVEAGVLPSDSLPSGCPLLHLTGEFTMSVLELLDAVAVVVVAAVAAVQREMKNAVWPG